MAFAYFPHTEDDVRQMLDRIGVGSLQDLYSDVPQDVIYREEFNLPDAMSEIEVRQYFEGLAEYNTNLFCLCGLGAYDHYSPAVIPHIISRSEFLTAYTPYQPEVSQGTLRYIFEYQSMITELTGMDCTNASMYDGATAAAEAMMMAMASTKKKTRVLVSEGLLPQVIKVVKTYAKFNGVELGFIPCQEGATSYGALAAELAAGNVAGVLVPGINKYGIIEDLTGFADAVHAQKGLLMVYSDPSSLAVIKTPGEWGADIVCGDSQTLGVPLCFGGPYVGFLACTKDLVRKLPGRIVGATKDVDGKRAYDLARQGKEVELKAKVLVIDEIELQDFNSSAMQATIRVVCSKGTYIRALARDIGLALESGAHLTALRRTRIGDYKVEDCHTLDTFQQWLETLPKETVQQ